VSVVCISHQRQWGMLMTKPSAREHETSRNSLGSITLLIIIRWNLDNDFAERTVSATKASSYARITADRSCLARVNKARLSQCEFSAGKRTPLHRGGRGCPVSSHLHCVASGNVQDVGSAARRERRRNFVAVGGGMGRHAALFQSALSATRSPSVIIRCPVIFFNHRSPRRFRAHFDGRAKGFGRARATKQVARRPPVGAEDKEGDGEARVSKGRCGEDQKREHTGRREVPWRRIGRSASAIVGKLKRWMRMATKRCKGSGYARTYEDCAKG